MIINFLLIVLSFFIGRTYGKNMNDKGISIDSYTIFVRAPLLGVIFLTFVVLLIFNLSSTNFCSFMWQMPDSFQVYYPIVAGYIFRFSIGLILGILFSVKREGCSTVSKRIFCYVFIILLAYEGAHLYSQIPIYEELSHRKTSDGVILQTSGASCVAASVANLLNQFYGSETTEREVAELLNTSDFGTTNSELILGGRKLGYELTVHYDSDLAVEQIVGPALMVVHHPATGLNSHMVCFMGMQNGNAEVWDPLHGKYFYSLEEIKQIWGGQYFQVISKIEK